MQSKSIVRGIIEEEGMLLVSFRTHDGYFRVPLTNAVLCAKIKQALERGEEISFTFDRALEIQNIQ